VLRRLPRARPGALLAPCLATALVTAGLLTGGAAPSSSLAVADSPPATASAARAARAAKPLVVVAVGDIACPPGMATTATTCKQRATAKLTSNLDPDAVLAVGDLQYESGSLHDFRNSYAKSWGKLVSITYPVPGNHEYRTKGASGYYKYFADRQPGKPGYYAFNLRKWRVYALNSNCSAIKCSAEYRWLKKDLEAKPHACSIAMMHHPRFSSGSEHGSNKGMSRFFAIAQKHGVDLVLAGHDHDYERFHRMRADGTVDKSGMMSFVSGAGGRSAYRFGRIQAGSAYRLSGHFGVLRLALRPHRFNFSFRDVDGTIKDRGKRTCR
jgi:3',5'-cyclic AMP phosphodiesterase CpdA